MMREKSISFQENARESRKSIKLQKAASMRRVIAQHCCSRDLSTAVEMKWFSLPSLPREWPKDVHLVVSTCFSHFKDFYSYSFLHFPPHLGCVGCVMPSDWYFLGWVEPPQPRCCWGHRRQRQGNELGPVVYATQWYGANAIRKHHYSKETTPGLPLSGSLSFFKFTHAGRLDR